MSFLNPVILFGLIAAGIPLIIHLFNFRRPKSVDFSSLAFLKELRQQTMRRLRIRQWLLLVLRTLAIACLVLAFARPTIESTAIGRIAGPGRTSTTVILDNSLSMLQRDQDGDYFSQARDELRVLAGELEGGDELTVIPLVSDPDAGTTQHTSPALAAEWVEDVEVLTGPAQLERAIRQALTVLEEGTQPNQELFLISDFQATNFPDSLDVEHSGRTRIYLVPTGSLIQNNVAITRVEVVSSIIDLGQPVSMQVEVANFGEVDLENWGVSIHLGEERVAQATVDLGAGQTATADLVLSPASRGWLPGYVELEDDGFPFDNRRYFTLHVPEARRVLIVRGEDTETRFVELALSKDLARTSSVFEVDAIEESALSSTTVSDYDAVVLNGVRFLSSGEITSIANFVEGGGGLLVFAGTTAPAPDQQALLRAIGGGTFRSLEGRPGAAQPAASLDGIDAEHPIFNGVFDDDAGSNPDVGHPAFYALVSYEPGSGDEQTIITASGGAPLLQEIRGSQGRVLLAPFVPEPDWTDLPMRGIFVPLLQRAMYYATSSEGESGDGVIAGSDAQIRLATGFNSRVKIESNDGQEWIPEQRGSLQGVLVTVPTALRDPGVYDITVDDAVVARLAVNGDPRESDLRVMDPTEVAARLSTPGGYEAAVLTSVSTELDSAAGGQRAGIEIWNVFLTLALVFLVVEMLVSKR